MRSMGKKGFTLVEIVVVMVVVGILAAITVPSLAKYIDDGKKRDCEINRKALLARLESCLLYTSMDEGGENHGFSPSSVFIYAKKDGLKQK